MAEKFCGTWKCIDSKDFGNYLTAIGAPMERRKRGDSTFPTTIFNKKGDQIILRIEHGPPTFNNMTMYFKLGEEFEEKTSDGRTCKTVVDVVDGKLVYLQKWDGKETSVVREIQGNKMHVKMVMEDVVSVRTYEKA